MQWLLQNALGKMPPMLYLRRNGIAMAIPDEVRKCVVFVGYKTADGEFRLVGTGFWLSRLIDGKSGDLVFAETKTSDWFFHPDESVDITVLRGIIPEITNHLSAPMEMFLTEETIREQKVGIGDDVFIVGLFSKHFGNKNNIPIVRTGNIAAMPDEKVKTRRGETDAYLVESRSIGGLSGSPVFLNMGHIRNGQISGNATFWLLGVVHGHFDTESISDSDVIEDGGRPFAVNTGIAIVTPIARVTETIFTNKEIRRYEDEHSATLRREHMEATTGTPD